MPGCHARSASRTGCVQALIDAPPLHANGTSDLECLDRRPLQTDSGRSRPGGFGVPEPRSQVPVSGRSCLPATDPSATPAAPDSMPGSGRPTLEAIMCIGTLPSSGGESALNPLGQRVQRPFQRHELIIFAKSKDITKKRNFLPPLSRESGQCPESRSTLRSNRRRHAGKSMKPSSQRG